MKFFLLLFKQLFKNYHELLKKRQNLQKHEIFRFLTQCGHRLVATLKSLSHLHLIQLSNTTQFSFFLVQISFVRSCGSSPHRQLRNKIGLRSVQTIFPCNMFSPTQQFALCSSLHELDHVYFCNIPRCHTSMSPFVP